MEILNIHVLRGPNYWSNYRHKLIVMKLDLGYYQNRSTNNIDGFNEKLQRLLPSLYTHRCSEGHEGGFFERLKMGTWLGHVIEHVALELQTLAGMECGFGRTRSTKEPGVFNVVFSYEVEEAGIYAAKAAVRLVETLISDMQYNLEETLVELAKMKNPYGPSTQSLIDEAAARGIPAARLNNSSLVMLGQGANQRIICATVACTTSSIAVDLASDKDSTKKILSQAYIPVPKGIVLENEEQLEDAIDEVGYPLVIKPLDGNHGRGITTDIRDREQLQAAFEKAHAISEDVIAEEFIKGTDYRFLVIDYKLVAVAKRTPAMVIGDDKSTIRQLIDETNRDPRRGANHDKVLTTITVDEGTKSILVEKNFTLNTVLPIGEILFLKDTANLSSGGTARDVTDIVHPQNVAIAERVARLMNLDICGIDIVAEDIQVPFKNGNAAILEVNAGPGFRMHLAPSKGLARNVAAPVIDMLYPGKAPARIPIVAVTGTNGKTTTTRLIAHMAGNAGHKVGYTTTEGIYIDNTLIHSGDCSGPKSAAVVLRDPIVDFAVFECARGGILRSGLGFDHCNISIVTNVTEDHLGLKGIDTIEELAEVKAVVPRSTFDHGYAILNADDELVYAMKDKLYCNVALWSMDAENPRILEHCNEGGLAAVVDKGYFTLCHGKWKSRIALVENVPLTLMGTAHCMIQNVLPAILAATLSDFSNEIITTSLKSFIPSPEMTPGRMNLFRFWNYKVMVDYAHNKGGYIELEKYMSRVKASVKIGIIAATGDRRDEDIRDLGICAARIFDDIIIRHDKDGRGRSNEEITSLLIDGIHTTKPDMNVNVISDELEAINYAMSNAPKDAFIFVCTDDVMTTLEFMKHAQEQDQLKAVA